jgi:transposase
MPAPKRPRREPTDEWEQLQLFVGWPEQERYELLRPIVLFGQTSEERARATGVSERTLERKADRFDAAGMASLFDSDEPSAHDRRFLPADIRHRILSLKAEYPAFRPNEIAEICRRRDDCRVTHTTVQRVLATYPHPAQVTRRYPPYAQITEPTQRRLAIVHLYFDGWNIKSIAGYLQTTRTRVYETLHRFFAEDYAGLPDQSRAPKNPARKVDFKAMAAIRRLQANADLGEWRVHAALAQMGIHLSPRTCGRIMAHNHQLGLPRPADPLPPEPRPMPFAATYRHEYWSVDVRYIEEHHLENPKPAYVISILENYSRALLASLLTPRQDLTAYLIVLRLALQEHGCPTGIVSDGGGIFKANQVLKIYKALGIERHQIESGQAWQNYIETHFNIMRRMADYHYARAESWGEMRTVHDRFFADYNLQPHWAHRQRKDGKRSPQEVLGWVHGVWCDEAELDRLFRLRAERVFDAAGYLRYKRWRIYGERGLAGRRGAIWLFGELLTVAYEEDTLVQYQVHYDPETRRIRELTAGSSAPWTGIWSSACPRIGPAASRRSSRCRSSSFPWRRTRRARTLSVLIRRVAWCVPRHSVATHV